MNAAPDDRDMTPLERTNWLTGQVNKMNEFLEKRRAAEADPDYQLSDAEKAKFPMTPPRVWGYVGKTKGMQQMAFECGAYRPGCLKEELEEYFKYRPDFLLETSELADSLVSRGNGFVLSVKCHPEMAGKG